MQTYTGGCHCGKVRFEVKMKIDGAIECNCSHCAIQGALLAFVPAGEFKLLAGEAALKEYRFNKKFIAHLFCHHCVTRSILGYTKNILCITKATSYFCRRRGYV